MNSPVSNSPLLLRNSWIHVKRAWFLHQDEVNQSYFNCHYTQNYCTQLLLTVFHVFFVSFSYFFCLSLDPFLWMFHLSVQLKHANGPCKHKRSWANTGLASSWCKNHARFTCIQRLRKRSGEFETGLFGVVLYFTFHLVSHLLSHDMSHIVLRWSSLVHSFSCHLFS